MFSITDKNSVIAPEDCGLVNGHISLNGWLNDVAEIRGLYAPPYFSDNFRLIIRFNDRRIAARSHCWRPERLSRSGYLQGLRVSSELFLMKEARAAIMRIEVRNASKQATDLRIQYEITGGCGQKKQWCFGNPTGAEYADKSWEDPVLALQNQQGEILVNSSLTMQPNLPVCSGVLEAGSVKMGPHEKLVFHTVVAIGKSDDNLRCINAARLAPEKCCAEAVAHWEQRVRRLFTCVPDLESDNRQLVTYYHRSLLHLLLNEWQVPEFLLHPHYGTGSIFGDTICCYMWNYGGPYRMWSLLSPQSASDHIRQLLTLDLTSCYAFFADDGTGTGPYYPINQEKVIFLAHAYVMQTRDTVFLDEKLNGRKIIEHLVEQALMHDNPAQPAVLVDYGAGNDHLELRSPTFATDPMMRYNGILPDMNLRRCVSFRLVDELCKLIGHDPGVDLVVRANALKKLVHQRLFSAEHGWFRGINSDGKEFFRYTIQMFKALGWGNWALEPEAEEALMGHLLNEKEFLGRFGLHSLSKLDPAYYEDDIDNGGPGACVSFAPAIIDRLYRQNRVAEAEILLSRLLWMGDSLPYWGDSQRADVKDYRRCSHLQCNIEGAVPAQTLIFGMSGIRILPDFSVEINPHVPESAQYIRLRNIRIAGLRFDVECNRRDGTTVTIDQRLLKAKPGEKILFPQKQDEK